MPYAGVHDGRMRAERRLDHARRPCPRSSTSVCRQPCSAKALGLDDALAGDVAPLRGPAEEVVEVRVGTEDLRVAARVGAVDVHERGVERERRHREAALAVGVGRDAPSRARGAGARRRSRARHASAGRAGGASPRGGPTGSCPRRAPSTASAPAWRAGRKCGSSGIRSSETKPKHQLPDLARGAEQADVRVRRTTTTVRSRSGERRISRTSAIGFRRAPQPPMPIVMPSRSSATTSRERPTLIGHARALEDGRQ